MIVAQALLVAVLAVGLLAWLYTFVATVRVIRSVKRIKDLPDPQLAVWPKLSVVVTARNEERRLAQAMVFSEFYPTGLLLDAATAGLVLLALAYGSTLGVNIWLTRFHFGMLLWPLSVLAGMYLMPRAAILGWRRGGIFWRGTFYPNEQLKAGVRLGSLS